jgi:hypothetical protein
VEVFFLSELTIKRLINRLADVFGAILNRYKTNQS